MAKDGDLSSVQAITYASCHIYLNSQYFLQLIPAKGKFLTVSDLLICSTFFSIYQDVLNNISLPLFGKDNNILVSKLTKIPKVLLTSSQILKADMIEINIKYLEAHFILIVE